MHKSLYDRQILHLLYVKDPLCQRYIQELTIFHKKTFISGYRLLRLLLPTLACPSY